MSPGALAPLFEPTPVFALMMSAAGALAAGLVGLFTERHRSTPLPVAGLFIATSATVALVGSRPSVAIAAFGVVLLAVAGVLCEVGLRPLMLRVGAAVPGAWVIAFGALPDVAVWVPWLVFFLIVVGAPLVADFGKDPTRAAWGPPLFAVTAGGIFLTVPDTEEAAVFLMAAAPVALLGWPLRFARLGQAGSFAAVGLAGWVIAWGGQGRETSIIGAAGCVGLLLVEPLARLLTKRETFIDRLGTGTSATLVVGAIHFLLVMATSRIAGLRPDVLEASVIVCLALGAGFLLLAMIKPGDTAAADGKSVGRTRPEPSTHTRR